MRITSLTARHGDGLLDELVADPAVGRVLDAAGTTGAAAAMIPPATDRVELVVPDGRAGSVPAGPLPHREPSRRRPATLDLLLAMGFCGALIGLPAARRISEGRRRPGQAIVPDAGGSRPLPGPRPMM